MNQPISRAASTRVQWAILWPLSLRSLRRFWLRYTLMAGLLTLAILGYLLYGTFLAGANREAALSLGAYELPCDIALLGARRALTTEQINEWQQRGGVEQAHTGRITWYHTELGSLRVLALPSDSPLWAAAGCAEALPAPGQLLLPSVTKARAVARWGGDSAFEAEGGPVPRTLTLIPPRAPLGRMGADVIGFHNAGDELLRSLALTTMVSPGPAPNCLFIDARTEAAAASLASMLRLDFLGPTRPLLYRPDGPAVIWAGAAEDMMRAVIAGTYIPAGGVMTLVLIFCGIGLFTVTSLAFLDRKRDLAILKTVGLDSHGITAMLLMEQLAVTLCALALALAATLVLLPRLAAYLPQGASLGLAQVAKGLIAGVLVQSAGVVLPSLSARVATVNQLLFNLPIPLERRRVYASKE